MLEQLQSDKFVKVVHAVTLNYAYNFKIVIMIMLNLIILIIIIIIMTILKAVHIEFSHSTDVNSLATL